MEGEDSTRVGPGRKGNGGVNSMGPDLEGANPMELIRWDSSHWRLWSARDSEVGTNSQLQLDQAGRARKKPLLWSAIWLP